MNPQKCRGLLLIVLSGVVGCLALAACERAGQGSKVVVDGSADRDHDDVSLDSASVLDVPRDQGTLPDGFVVDSVGRPGFARFYPEHAPAGCDPDCIWNLTAECVPPPSDSCVRDAPDAGPATSCYLSGTRKVSGIGSMIYYRPDGSVCMSFETDIVSRITTYKDGSGRMVAILRNINILAATADVECDGQVKTIEFATTRCSAIPGPVCLPGKCN